MLVVGIPLLVILAGILLNRQDSSSFRSDLRAEISGLRGEMNARFDSIQRDLREFYAEQARKDVRLSSWSARSSLSALAGVKTLQFGSVLTLSLHALSAGEKQ